jgi:hypothetical protein
MRGVKWISLRIGSGCWLMWHDNELSGSKKDRKYAKELGDYYLAEFEVLTVVVTIRWLPFSISTLAMLLVVM